MPKFGTENALFKTLLSYLKSAPSTLSNSKFSLKTCLNLESKMQHLVLLGLEFENSIVGFQVNHRKIV